ncbi:MAG: ribulose bisphosphate carboxylase small subunit, partial [Cyanobacteria bacterium P01_A01_bin.135]
GNKPLNGAPSDSSDRPQPAVNGTAAHSNGTAVAEAPAFSEAAQRVRGLVAQGYCVGIEHVDRRRFQTNAWQSFAAATQQERQAIAALADCLMQHPEHYVRVIGVDPKAKRRITEAIVQRPSRR